MTSLGKAVQALRDSVRFTGEEPSLGFTSFPRLSLMLQYF